MAQGRSTKIISMMKWIRTSRLSIKNFLSNRYGASVTAVDRSELHPEMMRDKGVSFVQGDAFTFSPLDTANGGGGETVTWMVSDIIAEPHRVPELLETWCQGAWSVCGLWSVDVCGLWSVDNARGPHGRFPLLWTGIRVTATKSWEGSSRLRMSGAGGYNLVCAVQYFIFIEICISK